MTGPRPDDELRRRASINNALDIANSNRGDLPVKDSYDAYLNERRRFLAQTMQDVLNANQVMFPPHQDFSDVTSGQDQLNATSQLVSPMQPMEDADLLGQARALGIPNAEKIPAEALRQIIDIHRKALHPEEKDKLGILAAINSSSRHGLFGLDPQAIGLGIEKGVSDIRQQLKNSSPAFMKDIIGEQQSISDTRVKIAESTEKVRMNLSASDQQLFDAQQSVGKFIPQGAAYIAAAEVIGGALGVAPIAGRIGPIARGYLAQAGAALASTSGLGTTWLPSDEDLKRAFDGNIYNADTWKALGQVISNNKAGLVTAAVLGNFIHNKLTAKYRPGQYKAENPSSGGGSDLIGPAGIPPVKPDGSAWNFERDWVDPYEGTYGTPPTTKLLADPNRVTPTESAPSTVSFGDQTSPTPPAIQALEETHLRSVTPDQVVGRPNATTPTPYKPWSAGTPNPNVPTVPNAAPTSPSAAITPTGASTTASPVRFTTEKGSVYVDMGGTTTRNKTPRSGETGGLQPESQKTIYVDQAGLDALSEFQTQGVGKRSVEILSDGRVGVRYNEGVDAGRFEGRTVITPQTSPAVGLYPVELWNGGKEVHFGHKIVSVTTPPTTAPSVITPTATPSPAAQAQVTQFAALLNDDTAWSGPVRTATLNQLSALSGSLKAQGVDPSEAVRLAGKSLADNNSQVMGDAAGSGSIQQQIQRDAIVSRARVLSEHMKTASVGTSPAPKVVTAPVVSTIQTYSGPRQIQGPLIPNAGPAGTPDYATRRFGSMLSTPAEVMPELVRLKALQTETAISRNFAVDEKKPLVEKMNSLMQETNLNPAIDHKAEIAGIQDQLDNLNSTALEHTTKAKELDSQIADLMDRSGIQVMPKAWQIWKQNPMAPVTASAKWAMERGVHPLFSLPDGRAMVMYHGAGRGFQDFDMTMMGSKSLWRGPGIYSSSSVQVTGGDPFDPLAAETSGDYAWVRARELQTETKQMVAQKATYDNYISTGMTPNGPLTPDIVQQYQTIVADLGQKIATNMETVAPNVRMHFLVGKNILDGRNRIDLKNPDDKETMLQLFKSMSETHPTLATSTERWAQQIQQDQFPAFLEEPLQEIADNKMIDIKDAQDMLKWDDVYVALSKEEVPAESNLTSNSFFRGIPTIGKDGVNNILKNAGFHHYVYEGGLNMGDHPHIASVTFDPSNVVPVFMDEIHTEKFAIQHGIDYNKQATIETAPNAADLVSQGEIGDKEVIEAQHASRPGSFNLLKGIEDPSKLFRELTQLKQDGTIKSFRVLVRNDGQLDLMTSSFGEITDAQVALYKEHGIFYGQQGVSPTGKAGSIVGYSLDKDGKIAFQTVNQKGKRANRYLPEVIKPGLHSYGLSTIEAPPLYDAFKKYALQEVTNRMHSAGVVGYIADWFDDEVGKRLPRLLSDFFNEQTKITEKGAQTALQRYFDLRRIDDVKALAPEEFARLDMIQAERDEAVSRALDEGRFQNIAAIAQLKGFTVHTNTGEPGYVLEDISNTNKIPFLDEKDIRTFLAEQDGQQVPDITPPTSMPVEATELPSDTHQIEGMSADQYMESVADEFARYGRVFGDTGDLESEEFLGLDFGGGPGGTPPRQPPSDGAGFGDFPFAQLPPGQRTAMVKHWTNLFRSKQANIAEIEGMISDFKIHSFMPQRNGMHLIENKLHEIGFTDPSWRPGKVFMDIVIAFDHARNAAYPVHLAANVQLGHLNPADLRNGNMWRVFEQHSPVHRITVGKQFNLKTKEIEAIATLRAQLEQAVGSERVKQFVDYIGDVRDRHQHNQFGPSSYWATNQPLMKDFAELMQQKNMQLMNLNLETLVPTFIRAHYFAQEVLPTWKPAMETWTKIQNINVDGKRPFYIIGGHITDWLDYIKTGHQAGFDAGTKLVRNMLRTFLPVSDAQAREVVNQLTMAVYRGQLGWRSYTIIKDTNQVMLAGPYVGWHHLGNSIRKAFMTGANVERQEMLARAIKYGTAQKGIVKTAGTHGFMEDDIQNNGFTAAGDKQTWHQGFQQRNAVRAQNAMDAIRTNIPDQFRNIEGTKLDPLHWYGNYNNWGRIVVGEAAYQNFTEAYHVYDMARKEFALGGKTPPDMAKFLRDSRVDAHDPSVVRGQMELVAAGRYEEAVMRHMNETNAETNLIYGNLNKPPGLRSNAAKMGMMYGNYTQGMAMLLTNLVTRPSSSARKAEMLALLGGMTALYEIMQAKTGWNFRNFGPLQAIVSYTGSPLLHAGIAGIEKVNAMERVYLASDQNSMPYTAINDAKLPNAIDFLAGAASAVNPAGGLVWAGKVARSASQSPDPFGTVAEAFITGGSSNRVQQKNAQMQWLDDYMQKNGHELNPHTIVPETRLPGPSQYHALQRDGQMIAGNQLDSLLNNVKQLPPEQQQQIIDKFLMSRGAQGSQSVAPSGGKGAQ